MRPVYRSALLLVALVAGCSRPARLPPCASGGARVGDATSVAYIGCGGRLFAAWTDISFDDPAVGVVGRSGAGAESVLIGAGGGRSVELKVWTEDGTALRVAVNGTEFRAEDGALFLVRRRGGAVQVTQLQRDLSGLAAAPETWGPLAEETPEVKAFIAQAAGKE